MIIRNTPSWGFPERTHDVETAVALSIDGTLQSASRLDAVEATADNAAAVMGRLAGVLVKKGLLDHEDVGYLLGTPFTVSES